MLRRLGLVIWVLAGLAACESDDETVLSGERQPALWPEPEVAADPAVADWVIRLPPATRGDWRQARANSENRPGHRELARPLELAWAASLGRGLSARRFAMPAPVVQGDSVYAMDAVATVTALDATDGSVRWTQEVSAGDDTGQFGGGLAVSGGRLMVTTGGGEVVALDTADGTEIWRRSLDAPIRVPPALGSDRVYVLSVDNQLTGLRIDDGERVWQLPVSGDSARMLGGAPPAVRGSAVLAAFASGDVVALSGENGLPVWRDSLAPLGGLGLTREFTDIVAPPVMLGDRAFVTAVSGTTIALDMRRGARVWTAPVGGLTGPALGDETLFVLDRSGRVAALTADRGRVVWWAAVSETNVAQDQVWSGPLLVDDSILLVGADGTAIFMDPETGAVEDTVRLPGRPATPPVVTGGRLYLVSGSGRMMVYE